MPRKLLARFAPHKAGSDCLPTRRLSPPPHTPDACSAKRMECVRCFGCLSLQQTFNSGVFNMRSIAQATVLLFTILVLVSPAHAVDAVFHVDGKAIRGYDPFAYFN